MKKILMFILVLSPLFLFAQNDNTQIAKKKFKRWCIGLQVFTVPDILMEDGGSESGGAMVATQEWNFLGGYMWGNGNGIVTNISPHSSNTYETEKNNDGSYSFGINSGFYMKNNNMFRLRIRYTKYNFNSSVIDTNKALNPYEIGNGNSIFTQSDWQLAFGLEKTFPIKNFNFYGGTEITIIIRGKGYANYTSIADTNNTFSSSSNVTGVYNNGWSSGLGLFFGINYNYNAFSLGIEISSAYMYNKYGGNYQYSDYYYYNHINTLVSSVNFKGYALICWQISPIITSINLSARF